MVLLVDFFRVALFSVGSTLPPVCSARLSVYHWIGATPPPKICHVLHAFDMIMGGDGYAMIIATAPRRIECLVCFLQCMCMKY